MSRIGRLPVTLPQGVKVDLADGTVKVTGPKGNLQCAMPAGVTVEIAEGTLRVQRSAETRQARAAHGLAQRLIANMVHGVSTGYSRTLEIVGVGYRAEARGQAIYLTLGYSHPILFQLPATVQAKVDKQTTITLESSDRQLLGEVASQIRALRPPEPYKGKGVRYADETIRRKAGKAAGAAGGG
jgi:large subunit ribosomal protein L6